MKKLLIITYVVFLYSLKTYPQWYWQNPLPQGNSLQSVNFVSSTVGFTVGQGGAILKTTDGGTTWVSQTSETTFDMEDIFFIDANNGWAVGWYRTILRTTNGGTTWTFQTSGVSTYFQSVCFTDLNNGTAVGQGGTILRTTDGGTNWTSQTSGTTNILWSVYFTDASTGRLLVTLEQFSELLTVVQTGFPKQAEQ